MTRPRAKSYGFQGSERVGIVLWKVMCMVGVEVVSFRLGVVYGRKLVSARWGDDLSRGRLYATGGAHVGSNP